MHLKQTSFPLPEPSLHLYLVIKILKPNNVILEILHIPMYLPSIVNTLTYTFWHRTNPSLTHKNWDLQVRQIRLSHYLRKHSFFLYLCALHPCEEVTEQNLGGSWKEEECNEQGIDTTLTLLQLKDLEDQSSSRFGSSGLPVTTHHTKAGDWDLHLEIVY